MHRRPIVLALLLLIAAPALRAETARELYIAAVAREQTVRASMSLPSPPTSALTGVRALVADYRAIVKQYPASGYSDNALWQAGVLSLDAFERFGQVREQTAGLGLLHSLAESYPTSKLAKQVAEQLARTGTRRAAAASAGPAVIRDIRRALLPDLVRIIIELDADTTFTEGRLNDPPRVFVDLASTRAAAPLADRTLRFEGDGDIVRQVRVGRRPNETMRVVVDAQGVSTYSVYLLREPSRLVIDCVRARLVAPLPTRSTGPLWSRILPSAPPRATAAIANASGTPPRITGEGTKAAVSARNAGAAFSIARQLGLSVSRVVIDPGHGGHDPGAEGRGVTEAELVLDVSLRLEKLLLKTPGTDVILTRRTDEFVSLQKRTAIANREGADLFLSIHANAGPTDQARGVETYFLNFANSMGARAVAARENAASGQAMGALPDFVRAIALNNKLDESREFAADVQSAMVDRLRGANKNIKDLGVKQAPFVVLIGAAMPSVLAEISFVTNPQESRLLRSSTYRQRIAEALASAVRKYQSSLKNVTTVATQ